MARRVKRDVEISGTRMAPGDRVLLSFGAASRDPTQCERPDEIDLARSPNRHLAFGAGNHSCIGASLARLILEIGYAEFLTRIPEFTVADGFEPQYETGNTRHMIELPIFFKPQRCLVGWADEGSPTSKIPRAQGAPYNAASISVVVITRA
jgi:cytochrome P450